MIIRILAVRTSLFLSSVLGDARRETQIIKAYANHAILTPPHTHPHARTAHLAMSKISTHLYRSRPKLISFDQIRKTQRSALTVWPQQPVISKSSDSQDHLFRRQPPSQLTPTAVQPLFPVWGFIITDDDCHILSAWAYMRAPSELRDTE